jgi:hypothetical protein
MSRTLPALLAASTLLLAACSDSATVPIETINTGSTLLVHQGTVSGTTVTGTANVLPAAVRSTALTLGNVQLQTTRATSPKTEIKPWASMTPVQREFNLMALETDASRATPLARGPLGEADFYGIRLVFPTAGTITFAQAVTVGSFTFQPDIPYALTIVDGATGAEGRMTGFLASAFKPATGVVTVDVAASLKSLTATSASALRMSLAVSGQGRK